MQIQTPNINSITLKKIGSLITLQILEKAQQRKTIIYI